MSWKTNLTRVKKTTSAKIMIFHNSDCEDPQEIDGQFQYGKFTMFFFDSFL